MAVTPTYADVRDAAGRVGGVVRPVAVTGVGGGGGGREVWLALEFMQHTGSFKARGMVNFVAARVGEGSMPEAGVVIASGGNAGLACAWAAGRQGVAATVFVPETAPAVKVARLRALGADVRLHGAEYAEALEASREYAERVGAVQAHAYDDRLVAAGAGTLLEEVVAQVPGLDTVVVAVGGGGLFAGTAASAARHGVRTVAVEPYGARALHAAIEAGRVVDVPVDSVAGDSLGARRVSESALAWARDGDVESVLVDDAAITATRKLLWDERRVVVEHGAATALAALASGAYAGREDLGRPERVCVVLCGANSDPSDLVAAEEPVATVR